MSSVRRVVVGALLACSPLVLVTATAGAHTDSDLVAVPAGSEAKVTLKPTHGCGGSPTIEVAIRAPLEGAVPGDVAGWTVTAEPDGQGRTVLRWTGGSLPADDTGAFPVSFTVPDTVGELLTFPSVQRCANGEELAWIDGDPAGEFPAPRLLVLPADAEPADSIDEVPADAPGREQLVEIVDVDGAAATTTLPATTTAPSTTSAPVTTTVATTGVATTSATTASSATTAVSSTTGVSSPTTTVAPADDDGAGAGAVIAAVAAVVVVGVGTAAVVRRRRR